MLYQASLDYGSIFFFVNDRAIGGHHKNGHGA
jgi:hypothetical protein